jgi:Kef-type K+ transport system membrane component KefB
VIITAAKVAGALPVRVRQPAVFGDILAGVVLGPSALNLLQWARFTGTSAEAALLPLVRDLADIGVLLLMFVAGLETDLQQVRRSAGSRSFCWCSARPRCSAADCCRRFWPWRAGCRWDKRC